MNSLKPLTKKETVEMMESRRGVYQVLARLWIKEVDEALWEGLKSTTFPSTPESPVLDGAYRELKASLQNVIPAVLKELASDYAVLCRAVDPRKGADPYESVHRNSLGLMMQDEWEEVLRFYREVGLERSAEAIEPEDHLGIELECMALLCKRAALACEHSDEQAYQESLGWQLQFLEDHLLLWVPSFAEAVLETAKTEFYRSVAVITREYLIMDAEFAREQME